MRGAREFGARFVDSIQLGQQVAAHRRQQVVVPERGFAGERLHQFQPGRRAEGHAHRHGAIERNHGRRRDLRQRVVERGDARPVGVGGSRGARMAGGDGGLQGIDVERAGQGLRVFQRRQAAPDQQAVPAAAILFQQQHRVARRVDARGQTRGLDFHQREQAVHLGDCGQAARQRARQPLRFLAQRGAHPVVACRGGVAFVEDQVQHFQHRRQARVQFCAARRLERHVRFGQRALGAHDALRNGGGRLEVGARDRLHRQAADRLQRQRRACLGRQQRVAGGEHQRQQVVADVVVERGVHRFGEIGFADRMLRIELDGKLGVPGRRPGAMAQ